MNRRLLKAVLVLAGCGPACPMSPPTKFEQWPGEVTEVWLEHLDQHIEVKDPVTWKIIKV